MKAFVRNNSNMHTSVKIMFSLSDQALMDIVDKVEVNHASGLAALALFMRGINVFVEYHADGPLQIFDSKYMNILEYDMEHLRNILLEMDRLKDDSDQLSFDTLYEINNAAYDCNSYTWERWAEDKDQEIRKSMRKKKEA